MSDIESDITFLDCETLGLDIKAPIWEFAAIRRTAGSAADTPYHFFIEHKPGRWLKTLPEEFRVDYLTRYKFAVDHPNPADIEVLPSDDALRIIHQATAGAHIVGAVPNFDCERIARMMRKAKMRPSWHYHLIDVENLIVGYMRGKMPHLPSVTHPAFHALTAPPWKSDDLSRAVGVDPDKYKRHTAMGDVEWVRDMYDAVMRNVPEPAMTR